MKARTMVLGIAAGLVLGLAALLTVASIFVAARPDQDGGAVRSVQDFREVSFSGVGDLYITQGSEESLTIDASPRMLRRIRAEVRGDTLYIGDRSGLFDFDFFRPFFVGPTGKIRFDLTVRDLSGLDISGAGDTYMETLQTDTLQIDMSGAGSLEVSKLDAESLSVDMSGAGSVEMAGRAAQQTIDMNGLGSLHAGDLAGDSVQLDLSGAGSATVWAREQLDVSMSGVGSVDYYGAPQIRQDVSGLGSVNSMGAR